MSVHELFTPDQIEALKNGEAISGSVKHGAVEARVFQPSTTTPISGYGTNLKPVIKDNSGKPIQQELVTRPNIDRHNKAAAERALRDLELADAAKAEQAKLDPSAINASLQALSRKVARLEKKLKEQS